jgi:hypothetical protein
MDGWMADEYAGDRVLDDVKVNGRVAMGVVFCCLTKR